MVPDLGCQQSYWSVELVTLKTPFIMTGILVVSGPAWSYNVWNSLLGRVAFGGAEVESPEPRADLGMDALCPNKT